MHGRAGRVGVSRLGSYSGSASVEASGAPISALVCFVDFDFVVLAAVYFCCGIHKAVATVESEMPRKFKLTKSEKISQSRVFSVHDEQWTAPNGTTFQRHTVYHPGAVAV